MGRRELAWALGSVLVLAGVVAAGYWALPRFRGGNEAPDFSLVDLDGREHNLTDYRGEVLVLDFMATWCGSCKIVQRNLAELQAEYGPQGVRYLTVDIDTGESRAQLEEYREKTNLTWPLAWDTDRVARKYSVFGIPKIVVVNGDGLIAFEREGVFTFANPGSTASVEVVSKGELRAAFDRALEGEAAVRGPIRVGLVGLAVLGGVFSFFAPCAFPLLPAYMGYWLNLESRQRPEGANPHRLRRGLLAGLAAGAGVLTVYGIIGALVVWAGQPVKDHLSVLQPIVAVVAILLGLAMVAGVDLSALVRPLTKLGGKLQTKASLANSDRATLAKVYGFGAGYGACASSCTAPVFLSVVLAGFLAGPAVGLRVFLAYALAAAGLMLLVTVLVAASRGTFLRGLARHARAVNLVSGFILVGAGAYLIYFYSQAYGF